MGENKFENNIQNMVPAWRSKRKQSEIVFLLVLIACNSVTIFTSLNMMRFHYERDAIMKQRINDELAWLKGADASEDSGHGGFWFIWHVKLALDVCVLLILFKITSLLVSDERSTKYLLIRNVLFGLQVILTFLTLWPFSAHGHNGVEFLQKQTEAIQHCASEQRTRLCTFATALFALIDCSKVQMLLTFISLAGISASSFVAQKFPLVLRTSSILNSVRISAAAKKQCSDYVPPTYDIEESNEPNKEILQDQLINKEAVKSNGPFSYWGSLPTWSGSAESTMNSDRIVENSAQESDSEHIWQPNYITFSNTSFIAKTENDLQTNTIAPFRSKKSALDSSFSTIGEVPKKDKALNWNPSLNYQNQFLDRSVDSMFTDNEEIKLQDQATQKVPIIFI